MSNDSWHGVVSATTRGWFPLQYARPVRLRCDYSLFMKEASNAFSLERETLNGSGPRFEARFVSIAVRSVVMDRFLSACCCCCCCCWVIVFVEGCFFYFSVSLYTYGKPLQSLLAVVVVLVKNQAEGKRCKRVGSLFIKRQSLIFQTIDVTRPIVCHFVRNSAEGRESILSKPSTGKSLNWSRNVKKYI